MEVGEPGASGAKGGISLEGPEDNGLVGVESRKETGRRPGRVRSYDRLLLGTRGSNGLTGSALLLSDDSGRSSKGVAPIFEVRRYS